MGIIDARHGGALLDSAAQQRGFASPRRRLSQTDALFGACTFTNPFAGTQSCTELRGDSWTATSAAERCGSIMPGASGQLTTVQPCNAPTQLAGWCVAAAGAEVSPLPLGPTCEAARVSCEGFGGGSFEPSEECVDTTTGSGSAGGAGPTAMGPSPAGGVPRCSIAPGPIGAAHQMGASPGYGKNCEGTPAEGSPFMWPLRWC
eukprot:jgi/Tetstr1/447670/TSEL_035028.t1